MSSLCPKRLPENRAGARRSETGEGAVLASSGCPNKSPQLWWLKQWACALSDLEIQESEMQVSAGWFLLEARKERLLHDSRLTFWRRPATLGF